MIIQLHVASKGRPSQDVAAFLPAKEAVSVVTSVAEIAAMMRSTPPPAVSLILLDSTVNIAAACQRLRQEALTAVIPLIAILPAADQREAALRAGVDDYLLLPLSAADVQLRLRPYLADQEVGRPTQFLLGVLGDVKGGIPFVQALIENRKLLATALGAVTATIYLDDEHPIKESANNVLCRPLLGERRQMGILRLEYERPILLTPTQRQTIDTIGTLVGHLLEISSLQEESQFYATQTAFLVLVAKMLAEQSDIKEMLSLTLEHAVSLLNACSGGIWLLSADGEKLELVSSLSASISYHPRGAIVVDRGILGWVATQNEIAHFDVLTDAPSFDAEVDEVLLENGRFLLAVPVHHQRQLGALVIQSKAHPFSEQDRVLLEGIASLLASSIANATKMETLRDYAAQQQALYEMSHQLAGGLDLQGTLHRALGWAVRLIHIETGLLWMVDRSQKNLQLAASHGLVEMSGKIVLIDGCVIGEPLNDGCSITINDPKNDPRYAHNLEQNIGFIPHNLLSVPLIYQGKPIGTLCLLNKIGAEFDKADADLLSTAAEMIALAVGNARLHAQTLTLMEERKRLYQQAIQAERLATVGRLTASLAHEINNPMQAIKGAMALALEEMDDPVALREYIELAMGQADRVAQLVGRMRQIYRPHTDAPETVALNHLLQEAISVARKEMRRQNARLEMSLAPDLPAVWASANQLHLVFLNTALNICQMIGEHGGGRLAVRTLAVLPMVRVEFITAVSHIPVADLTKILQGKMPKETGFGFTLSRDITIAHGGTLHLFQQGEQAIFRIELPALTSEPA